jgi:methylenetetrahydrofolate dehydrogenase (NADP+)/methenyltetrahydrofolate cyclohydrolase
MDTESQGRALAAARTLALAPEIERARRQRGRAPTLAILAADDPANRRFVELKHAAFQRAGLSLRARLFPPGSTTAAVQQAVLELNASADVDGIFLQFPLPEGVAGQVCADAIDPAKDVDAAGATCLGRLVAGDGLFVPAAPAAVLTLLGEGLGELLQRTVLVIGGDGVVARSILLLCAARGAICGITAPGDPALPDQLAGVDAAVITDTAPSPEALRPIRSGAVLVDAAYYLPRRPPDWLPERVRGQLAGFFPQYGNVGPLTVALLVEATVRAALAP